MDFYAKIRYKGRLDTKVMHLHTAMPSISEMPSLIGMLNKIMEKRRHRYYYRNANVKIMKSSKSDAFNFSEAFADRNIK